MTIAAFKAMGYALSARALLLVSIVAAFVLAVMAASHETQASLYVLVAWCVLTVVPIIALEFKRRRDE